MYFIFFPVFAPVSCTLNYAHFSVVAAAANCCAPLHLSHLSELSVPLDVPPVDANLHQIMLVVAPVILPHPLRHRLLRRLTARQVVVDHLAQVLGVVLDGEGVRLNLATSSAMADPSNYKENEEKSPLAKEILDGLFNFSRALAPFPVSASGNVIRNVLWHENVVLPLLAADALLRSERVFEVAPLAVVVARGEEPVRL